MRKEDTAVKLGEGGSDGWGDLVAEDGSNGKDSSGEPKRARFLDVFIARRLQTQEGMAGVIWRSGKNLLIAYASALRELKGLHLKLSICGLNSRDLPAPQVHRLADHFGAFFLSRLLLIHGWLNRTSSQFLCTTVARL